MAREIKIYGQTYQLTEGVENYAKVKGEFEVLSEQYGKQYESELGLECSNADAIMDKAYAMANAYFDKATDIILNKLAQNEIYTVTGQDIANLAEECGVLRAFDNEFAAVENIYYQIVQKAEEAKRQREIRKESRGRFVGGGFGFQGAMRGIIQAEMLNQATGMGHSIINSFGNARTEKEKKEHLETLYYVAQTLLSGALKTSVSNYYVVMLAVLDKYELITLDWPSEEDEKQAKAMLENLTAGRIPKEKVNDVLYKILTLDPFNSKTYSYILGEKGDSKAELEKFGEAHGINVQTIKIGMIDSSYYTDVMDECAAYKEEKDPAKFEKKLNSIQAKIDVKKKKLGLTSASESEKMIDAEMKNLATTYKTVDGIVFNSVEEAKLAQKDLKKFYECVATYGSESKTLREEIEKIKFNTDIVTANLENRLTEMKLLADASDNEIGKRISNILKKNGFLLVSNKDDNVFAQKAFAIGVSKGFEKNAGRARKLAGIPSEEKIILIFKNEKDYEDDFTWWVLTNDNLYTFDNDDDMIKEKKVVSFLDIEFIHADNKGNLVTRIKRGVDRTTKLELDENCSKDSTREKLTKAMEEIYYIVSPLTKGRSIAKKIEKKKKDTVELNVKELKKIRVSESLWEDAKEHACVNDGSLDFERLLNKAKQFWNCDFDGEMVYLVMVDSSIGSSVVLTSVRCYIHGTVYSTKQKYVFPVEKISTFRAEGKKQEYCMFFDVDFFKENYFNCSSGGVCFNTVKFKMFNVSEEVGEEVCDTLTLLVKKIRQPMIEREKKKEYFQRAIIEANDSSKAKKIVNELKADTVLDDDDRNAFMENVQIKLDKYQNAASNKLALEQQLSAIKSDDLSAINAALNQILSNDLFDENDKAAIIKLLDMQLEIGNKLYETELNNFFKERSPAALLLDNQPVYTKRRSKEIAEKICDFLTCSPVEIKEDEIFLLLFKNNSQFRSMPPSPPDAEECLFSNNRLMVSFRGKQCDIYTLADLNIQKEDIEHKFIRDKKNGKAISICFPYIKVDSITDKQQKIELRYALKLSEHAIVAKELRTFVEEVQKKTTEIKKMKEVLSKLPTDRVEINSFSKEKLEKEYKEWKKHKQYGMQVTNYLTMLEEAIKETYKKEASALCAGLSDMSVGELTELKKKLEKEFSDVQFSDFVKEEKLAVSAELQKKKDVATREEIAEKTTKLTSFTREELEKEYDAWVAYNGNVTEVKDFLQAIEEALRACYKKEASEMCADLESLSVAELDSLLEWFDKVFSDTRFSGFVAEERNKVTVELDKKKDMAVREEIAEDMAKLSSLGLNELEDMLGKWEAYKGKLPEVKEFTNSILSAIKALCKAEAKEMCANAEDLSVNELKELIVKLKKTFKRNWVIKEEITFVENVLIKKQEQEIKEWMPENTDALSEQELNSLITKYDAQQYDSSLYSVYALPLIEKRNIRIAEQGEKLAAFINSKAFNVDKCVFCESKEDMLKMLGRQTEVYADTLVCKIGIIPDCCFIYTKKFVFGQKELLWNSIAYFEFKKKFFGSTLKYQCKDGTSGEIKLTVPTDYLSPIADLLNNIHSYIVRNIESAPVGVASSQQSVSPLQQGGMSDAMLGGTMGGVLQNNSVAENNEESKTAPVQAPQQTVPSANGNTAPLTTAQRSFSEMAEFVNRFPSTTSTKIIGTWNPKFAKKRQNAVKAYAIGVREDEIFALYDDTLFGSGKEGFVMTSGGIVIKAAFCDTFRCSYSDIKGIKIIYDESAKLTKLFVDTQYGMGEISASCGDSGSQMLADRINEIVKFLYGLEQNPYVVEKSSQAKVTM